MGAPFERRRFRNEDPSADRTFSDVIRWAATRRPSRWPRWVDLQHQYRPRTPVPGELLVTFVNHATFLIQSGPERNGGEPLTLLTDPIWCRRAGPFGLLGPPRVHAPGIPLKQLPRVDVILLSHNHYDHMDMQTLRSLRRRWRPVVVTPRGNARLLKAHGIDRVLEAEWWESPLETHGFSVTITPAQHFSARTPFDRNRALWGGFALTSERRRLLFAGDSGYHTHFADVGARLGPFDVSLVPIGAYEPRWFMSANHMNPDEAVRAHLDLRSRLSVAMHFGCFQLTDEPIDEPVRHLAVALQRHAVPPSAFRVLAPGETLAV